MEVIVKNTPFYLKDDPYKGRPLDDPDHNIQVYGKSFSKPGVGISPLEVELQCFLKPIPDGPSREDHFKRITRFLYPDYRWLSDDPDLPKHAHWNDRQLSAACRYNEVMITGPASAAKSYFFALWSIINWIADPINTLVLVGSTDKAAAKGRIFGAVLKLHAGSTLGDAMPGKHYKSSSSIKLNDGTPGTLQYTDASSITLVAPDTGASNKNERLIGRKNERVIFVADEFTGMPESVISACGNLSKNPHFQFVGIGNASDIYDPHGRKCKPVNGWASVSIESDSWLTESGGVCLHFDGLRTPNAYTKPTDRYDWLITLQNIENDKVTFGGMDTALAYRFIRGFWSPDSSDSSIYSSAEIMKSGAQEKAVWLDGYIPLASLDPSFVSGGDRYMATFGRIGTEKTGKRTVLEYVENIALVENVQDPESVNFQVARKFIAECEKRGIGVFNVAIDTSSGGNVVADIITELWGKKGIYRKDFQGSATDRALSQNDPTPASAKCGNGMTEIWYAAKPLMRNGQIKGIPDSLAKEMTARQYSTREGGKMVAEPKRKMKARTGKSPDEADSFFIMIDLARERFGLAGVTPLEVKAASNATWEKLLAQTGAYETSGNGFENLAVYDNQQFGWDSIQ